MAAYTASVLETVIVREAVKAGRGSIAVNGTSDTLRFPHPASPSALSASIWFKIGTDRNFYSGIFSIEASSSTYLQFGLALDGTTLICNDLSQERSIQACSVGTWYFASFSIDSGGNVKMFVGTEGGTLTKYTTTLTNYTAPINEARIGGTSYGEYLDGNIADFRLWDAVLTDAEVFAEFYSESPVRTTDLKGWWPLENTTAKLDDYNGSNDLTNPGSGSFSYGAGPTIPSAKAVFLNEEPPLLENISETHTSGGGSYSGSVSETVSVSESLGSVRAAIVGPSETVTLSESMSGGVQSTGSASETVTLSESLGSVRSAVVAASETVSLSESIAASQRHYVFLTEFTDVPGESISAGSSSNYAESPSETISLSESVGAVFSTVGATAETVSASESVAALAGYAAGPAEAVSLSELVASVASQASALSETVTLSESVASLRAAVAALAETVTLSESAASTRSAIVSPAETVSLSEAIGSLQAATQALAETVSVAEQLAGTRPDLIFSLIVSVREAAYSVLTTLSEHQVQTAVSAYSVNTTLQGGTDDMIHVNTRVRLTGTFTTPAGVLYDPGTLALAVINDTGSETVYTYPTHIVKDSTGVYHLDVLASVAGNMRYQWRSTATGEEVRSEGHVRVVPTSF